jgi:hypothetical protein
MARDTRSIAAALAFRGDPLDLERQKLLLQLSADSSAPRNEVYNFAVALWRPIAVAAWNDGDRSPAVVATLGEIRALVGWVNTEGKDGGAAHGNAHVVFGQVSHLLGQDAAALASLETVLAGMEPDSSTWVGAAETKVRILVNSDRTDDAVRMLHEILQHHPDNAYAQNALANYEIDLHNEQVAAAGSGDYDVSALAVTPATFGEVQGQLTAKFQADITALMASGQPPAAQTAAMQALTVQFQNACQALQQKAFG